MAMAAIEDMDTARAVAKVHYDSYEWSGCRGARWDQLPWDAQERLAREAAEWIACIRVAGLT